MWPFNLIFGPSQTAATREQTVSIGDLPLETVESPLAAPLSNDFSFTEDVVGYVVLFNGQVVALADDRDMALEFMRSSHAFKNVKVTPGYRNAVVVEENSAGGHTVRLFQTDTNVLFQQTTVLALYSSIPVRGISRAENGDEASGEVEKEEENVEEKKVENVEEEEAAVWEAILAQQEEEIEDDPRE